MADEGIFATTAEILRYAGAGASSVSSAEAYTNQYIATAESDINLLTGINFSDIYSTLDPDTRDALKECAARMAANDVAGYDVDGYSSAREQENIMNYNYNRYIFLLKILSNKAKSKWLSEQTV